MEAVTYPEPCTNSRRRNLAELYLRAYWKTYLFALTWVLLVQIILNDILTPR